jgi:hypothetical protein
MQCLPKAFGAKFVHGIVQNHNNLLARRQWLLPQDALSFARATASWIERWRHGN